MTEICHGHEGRFKPKGLVPCFYCGKPLNKRKTWDHIVPKVRGGANLFANFLIACQDCNSDKGNMTLSEYRRYLWLKFSLKLAKRFVVLMTVRFWGETEAAMRGEWSPRWRNILLQEGVVIK